TAFNYSSLLDAYTEKQTIKQFSSPEEKPAGKSFAWFNSTVLFLGAMCFIVFLAEGSMLDWSAVFLRESRSVDEEMAGVGYAAFSIAMATMRLLGDRLIAHVSTKTVVVAGSLLAASGLFLMVLTPWVIASILGFILLGIGGA
ncbi:TPA: MFS transporter, partial [Escherichia coli]|nr:MFS transporter [Escherichia coli]